MNGWECTDSDCLQYRKYLGERRYRFIQTMWLDSENNEYAVCVDEIDLKNFFYHDLELAISGYYDSLTDMEEKYQLPIGELDGLIAECYFENYCIVDECSFGGTYTWEEAKAIINKYMEEN